MAKRAWDRSGDLWGRSYPTTYTHPPPRVLPGPSESSSCLWQGKTHTGKVGRAGGEGAEGCAGHRGPGLTLSRSLTTSPAFLCLSLCCHCPFLSCLLSCYLLDTLLFSFSNAPSLLLCTAREMGVCAIHFPKGSSCNGLLKDSHCHLSPQEGREHRNPGDSFI